MHRISNQNKNRNGDFKMNKAVIYFGATGNEAADQIGNAGSWRSIAL